MSKTKFCEVGNHEVDKLWHSKRKERPSCCHKCLKREPIRKDKSPVVQSIGKEKKFPVRSAISPISDKQKERLKQYRKVRDAYMKAHPICEFPECNNPSTELHHGAGKVGDLLFDDRYFKALDHIHHRFVEENPLEAQKLGLSFKRLDK